MLYLRQIFAILLCFFLIIGVSFADDTATKDKKNYFLVLADLHFDPFISCQSVKTSPCPLVQLLRQSPVEQWPRLFAEYDKTIPEYRQDSNYPLLISALGAAKKTAEIQQAKFVLVLGDFFAHKMRYYYRKYSGDSSLSGYQAFAKKTLQFLTLELARTFPTTDVYPLVGNNDSYRRDYGSDPHGVFYQDAASSWSQLIKTPANRQVMRNSFPNGGYYAVDLPNQSNMRLIMLNSVLFSYKGKGKEVEQAANAELAWLHNELLSVRKRHQKALIAMHIPVGVDVYATLRIKLFTLIELWKPAYTERFRAELAQFAPEISAMFTGHLHADWYQILTFNHSDSEIPASGTPSISPIFGNNPGFKIYSYYPDTRQLANFTTVYYPLKDRRTWITEYNFNHIYQPHCENCSILNGMQSIQQQGELAERYKQFYAVNTTSQPITTQWVPYYWCAIREWNGTHYKECTRH